MSQRTETGTLLPMTGKSRGAQIKARREKNGLSVRRLAKRAKMDPTTASKAEGDDPTVTDLTYSRLIKALDDYEHETTSEAEEIAALEPVEIGEKLVRFTAKGNFGIEFTVEGPISDMAELREAFTEVVRSVRSAEPETDERS